MNFKNKKIFHIFLYLALLNYINSKNIILPFKKISYGNFLEKRTINDLISYHIYTTISMGTPLQTVAHFIDLKDYSFYFKEVILSFDLKKYSDIKKTYFNLKNFWFDEEKSTSFSVDYDEGIGSDTYYFQNNKYKTIKIENFRHNIYSNAISDKNRCGVIGLNSPTKSVIDNEHMDIFFISELKKREVISEYYYTIFFDENNSLFEYNNILNFGKIIIGESLYRLYPNKYKKEDEIIIHGVDNNLLINQIKFNSIKGNYTEEKINIKININTGFIRGSNIYQNEIEKIFFSDLLKNKLCILEYLEENVYENKYYIYSCENNKNLEDIIKTFPALFIEIKENNLTFVFSYKDLFKSYNDKIYFMVIFRDEKYSQYNQEWVVGELFLRKYITSYNYDTKSISFYKNQVDEELSKYKVYNNEVINGSEIKNVNNSNSSKSKTVRTVIEVLMVIFIFITLFLLYRKNKNTRKIRANELEDNNFEYISKINDEQILSEKKMELNKIIN